MDLAGAVKRCRAADGGDGLIAEGVLLGFDIHRQQCRVLVHRIHLEDMVGRGEQHLLALGEDHGLEHIDGLCDVAHAHAFTVAVEYVQIQGSDQRVAQTVLLVEEARIRARLNMMPGAPFVDDQGDALLGVVPIHDGPVIHQKLIHDQRPLELGEPVAFLELRGGTRLLA